MPLFNESDERIRSKDNRESAYLALARVKLADEIQSPATSGDARWTVAQVCDVYLTNLHLTASSEWADQVASWLNDLCRFCGALTIDEFKRRHLRDWLARHKQWSDNTRRNVIGSVKAAFNFCVREGDIDVNPVAGFAKPPSTPRVTAFSPEEEKQLYEATDEAFGLFLKACILTGARPYSELARVTADHIVESDHGMYYELREHKTAGKTGRPRRILLCDEMEQITRKLVESSGPGSGRPLFRSTRGRDWQRRNCVFRFRELRQKLALPADRCVYTSRHTFAKRMLSGYYTGQPVTIEVLAGLMGNSPKVCWQHYAQWADQYIDPLWAALGRGRNQKSGGAAPE